MLLKSALVPISWVGGTFACFANDYWLISRCARVLWLKKKNVFFSLSLLSVTAFTFLTSNRKKQQNIRSHYFTVVFITFLKMQMAALCLRCLASAFQPTVNTKQANQHHSPGRQRVAENPRHTHAVQHSQISREGKMKEREKERGSATFTEIKHFLISLRVQQAH